MQIHKDVVWHQHQISKAMRSEQKQQKPCILWFTGLSASGKSSIAGAVEQLLFSMGHHTFLLDGDNVRHGLNKGLGFSKQDRIENIRRVGEAAKLFTEAGLIVLTAFISPYSQDRRLVRNMVGADEFIEIFIDTPLDICEQRDPKGLYQKARAGEISNFTGIDSPYERPQQAELTIINHNISIQDAGLQVVAFLQQKGYLRHE